MILGAPTWKILEEPKFFEKSYVNGGEKVLFTIVIID